MPSFTKIGRPPRPAFFGSDGIIKMTKGY